MESLLGASSEAQCLVCRSSAVINNSDELCGKMRKPTLESPTCAHFTDENSSYSPQEVGFPGLAPSSPRPFLRHHPTFQHLQVTHGVWGPLGTTLGAHRPNPEEVRHSGLSAMPTGHTLCTDTKMSHNQRQRPWSQLEMTNGDPLPLRPELESTTS